VAVLILTTATVTSAHTIYAFSRVHLGDDNVSALPKSVADARGVIEGDGGVVSCSSSDCWDGEVISVDEDRVSFSARKLFSTCRNITAGCVGHTGRTRPP